MQFPLSWALTYNICFQAKQASRARPETRVDLALPVQRDSQAHKVCPAVTVPRAREDNRVRAARRDRWDQLVNVVQRVDPELQVSELTTCSMG